ncbi:PilZ domain-containing protein [Rhodobium gokarnense]|uniref:PilZ domain-containing protein n=1 Tax=Rhodobium gokarnense TaxID=364296 RepID=A0ABT3H6K9_9HYPH|nr:PilZ domain-containing protein [Rhodobium gokarnense]MCW2306025.1 hypothetical protein [Rhodobium gokarnense]
MSEPDLFVFHEPAEGDIRLPTSARVIDRERLISVEAKVHSFRRTGCVLETRDNSDVPDYLSLHFNNLDQLIGACVTWRRGKMTGVDFETGSLPENDLRQEARVPVNMPAVVKDPTGDWKASCVITDASRSGCRLRSDKAMSFPIDVQVNIEAVDRPIGGKVVWRRKNQIGVALSWNERRPAARDEEPFRLNERKARQGADG